MEKLVVHMANEEPIVAEVEELPNPSDAFIRLLNPRRRDGKDLHYVSQEVEEIIVPWHRINFVEIIPSAREEEIVSPFA